MLDYAVYVLFVLYGCGSDNVRGYDYAYRLQETTLISAADGDTISMTTEHIAMVVCQVLESLLLVALTVVPLWIWCCHVLCAQAHAQTHTPAGAGEPQPQYGGVESVRLQQQAAHSHVDGEAVAELRLTQQRAKAVHYARAQYAARLLLYLITLVKLYQVFTLLSVFNTITLQAQQHPAHPVGFEANWATLQRLALSAFAAIRPFTPQSTDGLYAWTVAALFDAVGGCVRGSVVLVALLSSTTFWVRMAALAPVLLCYPLLVLMMGAPLLLYHYVQQAQFSSGDSGGSVSYSPITLMQQLSFAGLFVALWLVTALLFPLFESLRVRDDVLRCTQAPRLTRCDVWRVLARTWIVMSFVASCALLALTLFQYNVIFPDAPIDWSRPSSISTALDWANWSESFPLDVTRAFGVWMLLILVACLVCACVAFSVGIRFDVAMESLQRAEFTCLHLQAQHAQHTIVAGGGGADHQGYVSIPDAAGSAGSAGASVSVSVSADGNGYGYQGEFAQRSGYIRLGEAGEAGEIEGEGEPAVYVMGEDEDEKHAYACAYPSDYANSTHSRGGSLSISGNGGIGSPQRALSQSHSRSYSPAKLSSIPSPSQQYPYPVASAPPATVPHSPTPRTPRTAQGTSQAPVPSNNANTCVICIDRPKTHAFLPCGHNCVCHPCALEISSGASSRRACPVCRTPISTIQRIFV